LYNYAYSAKIYRYSEVARERDRARENIRFSVLVCAYMWTQKKKKIGPHNYPLMLHLVDMDRYARA